jgi:hypothetical protein
MRRKGASFATTCPHPCVFHSHPCERVTFSCLPKRKSPKRKAPRSSPVYGHPALRLRDRAAGFVDGTSVYRNERARIVRAPLRADPPPARRTATGTRESSALLRAQGGLAGWCRRPCSIVESIAAEAGPTTEDSHNRLHSSALLRAGARCSSRVPFSDGGRWTISPKGERDGSRSLRRQRTDALWRNRPPHANPQGRMPGGRRCGGVLSWGYPSLDKQRRVTGPQGCGSNQQGRGSVVAKDAEP